MQSGGVIADWVLMLGIGGLLIFFLAKRFAISAEFRTSWTLMVVGLTLLWLACLINVLRHFSWLEGWLAADYLSWVQSIGGFSFGIALVLSGTLQWLPKLALKEKENAGTYRFYKNLVQEANSIFLRWGTDGRVIFINKYGESFFGYPLEKLKGRSVIGTIVPETESSGRDLIELIEDIQKNPENYRNNENENITSDGKRVWVSWRNASVTSAIDGSRELISIGVDITERKLAQDALTALAASISFSAGGQADTLEETIKYLAKAYNAKFSYYGLFEDERRETMRILAFWDGETMKSNLVQKMSGLPCADVALGRVGLISTGVSDLYPQDQILQMRRIESYFGAPIKNGAHEVIGVIAVMDEEPMYPSPWSRPVLNVFASRIGAELERKSAQDNIYELAHYDVLTELPNRQLFNDRLEQLIVHAGRSGSCLSLLFIDLDRFKNVNDTVGHAGGDLMLRAVAERLLSCVRANDTVSRLGGDEFVVLLADMDSEDTLLEVTSNVCQMILDRLSEPFFIDGCQFFISASIGVTSFPQDGRNMDFLIRNADTAMYHAKEKGGNIYEYYQPVMNDKAERRMHIEADLRVAVTSASGQLELYFQPIVHAMNGALSYMEALIRWNHPQHGLVAPDAFIEVAEESGLIIQLGDWVISQACKQLSNWRREGVDINRLSINISARQLEREGLVETLKCWTEVYKIQPQQLILEITESTLMDGNALATPILQEIKKLGFMLAIDDFGTGYSSFGQLRNFHMDILKIDKSFICDLPEDRDAASIVSAMIAMAHNLGQLVVAEGVENEAQLGFVQAQGCHHVQGNHFSAPMREVEIQCYLAKKNSLAAVADRDSC